MPIPVRVYTWPSGGGPDCDQRAGMGERFEAACRRDDFELLAEPDFTIVTDLDFLFNPDLLRLLNWKIPDWIDLSPLVPDSPPDEWPETAADQPAS